MSGAGAGSSAAPTASTRVFRVYYKDYWKYLRVKPTTTVAEARIDFAQQVRCKDPNHHVLVALWNRQPATPYKGRTLKDHEVLWPTFDAVFSNAYRVKLLFRSTRVPCDIATTISEVRFQDPRLPVSLVRLDPYIEAGFMLQRSRSDPRQLIWRRKYFVLTPKALLHYRGWHKGWKAIGLAHSRVRLVDTDKHPDLKEQRVKLCFEIATPTRSFQFRVLSSTDLNRWLLHFKYAIHTATDNDSIELAECLIADRSRIRASPVTSMVTLLHCGELEAVVAHPLAATSLGLFLATQGADIALQFYLDVMCFATLVDAVLDPWAVHAGMDSTDPSTPVPVPVLLQQALVHVARVLLHKSASLFPEESDLFEAARGAIRRAYDTPSAPAPSPSSSGPSPSSTALSPSASGSASGSGSLPAGTATSTATSAFTVPPKAVSPPKPPASASSRTSIPRSSSPSGGSKSDHPPFATVSRSLGHVFDPMYAVCSEFITNKLPDYRDSDLYRQLLRIVAVDRSSSEAPVTGPRWFKEMWRQILPLDTEGVHPHTTSVSNGGAVPTEVEDGSDGGGGGGDGGGGGGGVRSVSPAPIASEASFSSISLAFGRPHVLPDPVPLPTVVLHHLAETVPLIPPESQSGREAGEGGAAEAAAAAEAASADASVRTTSLFARTCGFSVLQSPPPAPEEDSDGVSDDETPFSVPSTSLFPQSCLGR